MGIDRMAAHIEKLATDPPPSLVKYMAGTYLCLPANHHHLIGNPTKGGSEAMGAVKPQEERQNPESAASDQGTPLPSTSTHPHHWLIDPPQGATSLGVCARCGEQRYFENSMKESLRTKMISADWERRRKR